MGSEYIPSAGDIASIVDDLGALYLGTSMPALTGGGLQTPNVWTSRVSIHGTWNGMLVISCTREFAVQATSDLLGVSAAEVSEEDAADGVGELANVIAGNLKAIISSAVGSSCRLSLPRVEREPGQPEGGHQPRQLWFSWRGNLFCVTLVPDSAGVGSSRGEA
jgi:chemotaxis protein CheX